MIEKFAKEVCEQAFDDYAEPLVSYGAPFSAACSRHAKTRFNASRIYIIASRSLAENTSALAELKAALEGKVAKVRIGFSQHTPMGECLAVMKDMRDVQTDLIVTLGGGSIVDAAKIIAYVRRQLFL